jgi:hypothetical protein
LFILVVITFTFLIVLIGISTAMISLANTIKAPEIRMLVYLGAFAVVVVSLLLVGMRFWPLYPLVMRTRFGSDTIRESLAITRTNLMTSFLLAITIFFFIGFGFGMFGLGLPLAIPLVSLASEVALRLIEGRRIAALESDEF